MEYVRNVFRKLLASVPAGSADAEHEQCIPVLLRFFEFDAAEEMQMRRARGQLSSDPSGNSSTLGALVSGTGAVVGVGASVVGSVVGAAGLGLTSVLGGSGVTSFDARSTAAPVGVPADLAGGYSTGTVGVVNAAGFPGGAVPSVPAGSSSGSAELFSSSTGGSSVLASPSAATMLQGGSMSSEASHGSSAGNVLRGVGSALGGVLGSALGAAGVINNVTASSGTASSSQGFPSGGHGTNNSVGGHYFPSGVASSTGGAGSNPGSSRFTSQQSAMQYYLNSGNEGTTLTQSSGRGGGGAPPATSSNSSGGGALKPGLSRGGFPGVSASQETASSRGWF